ncbi:Fic family protein [Phocoenobacter skyensis]|uniref:Protein adenylyltransferase n=1 Tax=Phocoenobacter skyensis TaxID=97481 RepID=A0ABT9JI72_9PAST|nr:Fic family protein [Pasteurella skyensis]MDP8078402.1 Fic family protein [Pasteurella skyensis]MDP8084506.1 Fic family protein [Pasteurella skyensis]
MNNINFNLDNAVKYHYGQFPPQSIDYQLVMNAMIGATEAIARFDQMLKNIHNSEILLAPLRNQEAVISSRMEGTISTIDEIMRYDADYGDTSEYSNEVREDIIETVLYQRTLKGVQQALNDGYPFSKALLKMMHQQLLSYGRGAKKSPGEFKKEQNYLGDHFKQSILFVPISPEKLEEGLDNLFDYINNNSTPILLKTAISHLEFEALHPFQDGNGRIGRMLITLILWRSQIISAPHFYISGYFEEHKNTYIDLMREVSETGNWNNWCIFFLNAIKEQAQANLLIAEKITQLYENMKTEFAVLLSSKWSINALEFIFTNPVFRSTSFTVKSGIPKSTAIKFTKILQEHNILEVIEEGAGRTPTLYAFEPLMKLVRI